MPTFKMSASLADRKVASFSESWQLCAVMTKPEPLQYGRFYHIYNSYAMAFNRRNERNGSLFVGNYP